MRTNLVLIATDRFEHICPMGINLLTITTNINISISSRCASRLIEITGRSIDIEILRKLIEQAETIGQCIIMKMSLDNLIDDSLVVGIILPLTTVEMVVTQTYKTCKLRSKMQVVTYINAMVVLLQLIKL